MTRRRDISDEQIIQLRQERAKGALLKNLARKYGICKGHVSRICTGNYYPHHPGPITHSINMDHCRRGHKYTDETLRLQPRIGGGVIKVCIPCRKSRRDDEREGLERGQ